MAASSSSGRSSSVGITAGRTSRLVDAVPPIPFGVAITSPAGSVSLNALPDNALLALGLAMVNVRLVEPPSGTLAAPNALMMVGGEAHALM